MTQEWEEKE